MLKLKCTHQVVPCVLSLVMLLVLEPVSAANDTLRLRVSALSSLQERNTVQIPNTDLGTRFSLKDAVGEGPTNTVRVELNWMFKQRHGMRVLLAPLTISETVQLEQPVRFAGEQFTSDKMTQATYRFNSWRLGYHYLLRQSDASSLRVGATLKIRDAEIRLVQGDTVSFKDDLGIVPLLYVAGRYKLGNRWSVGADLDGLAGGPGRAIDLGLAVDFAISERWRVGGELRVLDGGADNDEVYNFAQFNSAAIVVSAGF